MATAIPPLTPALRTMQAAGWTDGGMSECNKCHQERRKMESPSGTYALVNDDGSLHIECLNRDPEPEPLPPPTDQAARLKEMQDAAQKGR